MSPPSEFDLRAALHDGEGGNLDVDHLIVHARARAAERRVHLLSAAAVVAVVAAAGAGGFFLFSGNGSSGSAHSDVANGDAAGGAAGAGSSAQSSDGVYGPARSAGYPPLGANGALAPSAAAHVRCPAVTSEDVASGSVVSQHPSATSLFGKPVASIVVCAYGDTLQPVGKPAAQPARLVLATAAARRLAASLENAQRSPSALCPVLASEQFVFIGIAPDGSRAGTVAASLATYPAACGAKVTNGSAVRFGWVPPPDLRKRLLDLTPNGSPKSPAASPTK